MAGWNTFSDPQRWSEPSLREAGGVSSIVANIMAQREKQRKDLEGIPKELAGAYQSWKNEKIAANLLNKEAGPDTAQQYLATGMKPTDAYQMYQWDQEGQRQDTKDSLDSRYKESSIANMMRKAASPEQTVPYEIDGKTYQVPVSQYVKHIIPTGRTGPSGQLDKRLGQYGLTQDDLQNIDEDSLNLVDEQGNAVSDEGRDSGGNVVTPGTVEKENKTFVTGQAGDKAFRIPRPTFRNLYQTTNNLSGNPAKQMYSQEPPNSTPPSDVPPSQLDAASGLNDQDKQALDWANANPKDPRAAAIKKRLGVQ